MTFRDHHSSNIGSVQTFSTRLLRSLVAVGLLALIQSGCSSDPASIDGTSSGGALATGGSSPGAGGLGSMSGGASSSGGTNGSGGVTASGGAIGSGGVTASGGANGSGGESASGGADGSGGGTVTGFQPCPSTGSCKILPLGDSITYGMSGGSTMPTYKGAYRAELFHLALTDKHDITFTGTQMPNGPQMVDGVTFPQGHEGISGQTIDQIAGRVPAPALNEMPHIVLIHAGTNDVYGSDPSGAPARLEALVDKLIMDAPDALLVLATIIPYPPQAKNVALLNDTVAPLVMKKAAAGAHVILADQFTNFPADGLSSDGVHPNQGGYEKMGQVWYDAIKVYLP